MLAFKRIAYMPIQAREVLKDIPNVGSDLDSSDVHA